MDEYHTDGGFIMNLLEEVEKIRSEEYSYVILI